METWYAIFAMHICHGTDLELSPTTTVTLFFKWQWSQCIRKQCQHLAASRGTLCTETCTVKAQGFLEDSGHGLQGFLGCSSAELESRTDLEFSPETSKPRAGLLLLPTPYTDGQGALNTWGSRRPLKYGRIQSPNKLTKTTEQDLPPQDAHTLM